LFCSSGLASRQPSETKQGRSGPSYTIFFQRFLKKKREKTKLRCFLPSVPTSDIFRIQRSGTGKRKGSCRAAPTETFHEWKDSGFDAIE